MNRKPLAAAAGILFSLTLATPGLAADPTADGVYCPPETHYEKIADQGRSHQGVGAAQANYNGTGSPATSTFSAQVSGTVGMSYESSASVSASVIVAEVNAALKIVVSTSVTATLGNSTTVTAPHGKTAYARYGVWRKKTHGQYVRIASNCAVTSTPTTAWSPWYVGWDTWIS